VAKEMSYVFLINLLKLTYLDITTTVLCFQFKLSFQLYYVYMYEHNFAVLIYFIFEFICLKL